MGKQSKNTHTLLIVAIIIGLAIIIFGVWKFLLNTPKEAFQNTNTKKIAFCFLINRQINNEDLWHSYLKDVDPSKYNIYIHYKEDKPLKHFNKYKLKNTIETCWGCLSIVQAQNLVLKEALKDKQNQHFIWLSESCIPVKSFNHIYEYLDTTKSYYNIAPDSQVFPRAEPALKYIKKENLKKAAMPAINCRKHAQLFVDNDTNIATWFKGIGNVDEIVLISLLYHNNLNDELITTPNLSADAIIFTGWPDMSNYKLFAESTLTKNQPNEYGAICEEELRYLVNSKSLFARKFIKDCKGLDKLLPLIS